jgi:hypothetical protein
VCVLVEAVRSFLYEVVPTFAAEVHLHASAKVERTSGRNRRWVVNIRRLPEYGRCQKCETWRACGDCEASLLDRVPGRCCL